MIVDVHTHFLNYETDCTVQVRNDMQRCGIDPAHWQFTPNDHLKATREADVAIVFGMLAAKTGWRVPNEEVAKHVQLAPERLIFFASIDPGTVGYMDELVRCHQELGCCGVKLGAVYQGVHPLDAKYYEIYSYCCKHGLPIITHMATTFSSGVPLDYARPIYMDQVACDFPDLRIVLTHLGHPWEGETLAIIRKQPNVFADLSALYYRPWQFYNSMRLAMEYHAEGKILFGSDYPATTTATSLTGIRNINNILAKSGLPAIPETLIEELIHRDSLSLLGLSHPGKTGKTL